MPSPSTSRRECLALLGAASAAGVAGCFGGDTTEPDATASPTDEERTPTATATHGESVSLAAAVNGLVAEYDTGEASANRSAIRTGVAAATGIAERNVRVDEATGVVEVRADAEPSAVVTALDEAGVEIERSDVRRGVAESTLNETVDVLRERFAAAGYENATVTAASNGSALRIEVPGAERSAVADVVERRGRVGIVASFPAEAGDGSEQRRERLVTQEDVARVGPVRHGGGRPPFVLVTLTDEAATRFTEAMTEYGFTDEGVGNCRWQDDREDPGYCLHTVVDGEVQYAAGISAGLAEVFRNGEFAADPQFRMTAVDAEAARELKRTLESGALPTTLDVEVGDGD